MNKEQIEDMLIKLLDPRTQRVLELIEDVPEDAKLHQMTQDIEQVARIEGQAVGVRVHFEFFPVRRKLSKKEGLLVPKFDADLPKFNEPEGRRIIAQMLRELDE